MRFLVYWGLRRKDLCDPDICPHEDAGKPCPLDTLEADMGGDNGQLIQRALDLKAALTLGVNITLDDIPADEFIVMLVIEQECDRFDEEREKGNG